MMNTKLLLLTPALLLSACATPTDDPTKGGLLGGIHGLGGAYDQRIEARERNLDALKQAQKNTQDQQQDLRQEHTRTKTEHDILNKKVTTLTTSIN